jgi:NADH-quinone oxidoreductase subunit N
MSTLMILVGAGLLVPLFYNRNMVFAKLFATAAFAWAIFNVIQGNGIEFKYFELNSYVQLLEVVTLVVLGAATLAFSGTERPFISQNLFIAAASMAILETNNFLMYIVLFEVIAIISYVFAANIRTKTQAEGAIKMFIAGATASGVILFGFAMFAMVTDSFDYDKLAISGNFTLIAVAIMLAGIFYKLTIVPMHAWGTDAYAQVNHSAAGILSGVIKTVVVIATFKAFHTFMVAYADMTVIIFSFFAVLTMTVGNFMALFQRDLGKILSFSSIAHAGYMLIPFAAVLSVYAPTGLLYLGIAYVFMQTSVFLILNDLRRDGGVKELDDLKGLASRAPIHSLMFTIQLFSLAGIPPLAGFISKAVGFYAGVDAGLWPIILVALLNSAVSVGYYAWIVKHIYFDDALPGQRRNIPMSPGSLIGQLILLAGTLYFGIIAADVFAVEF